MRGRGSDCTVDNGSKLLQCTSWTFLNTTVSLPRPGLPLRRSSLDRKLGTPSKNRKFSKFFRFLKNRCGAIFKAVPKLFGHPSDPEWECRCPKLQVSRCQGHREKCPYVPEYISGHRQKWRIAISGLLISVGSGPYGCPLVQRASTLEHGKLVKFRFSDFARTPAIRFDPIYIRNKV